MPDTGKETDSSEAKRLLLLEGQMLGISDWRPFGKGRNSCSLVAISSAGVCTMYSTSRLYSVPVPDLTKPLSRTRRHNPFECSLPWKARRPAGSYQPPPHLRTPPAKAAEDAHLLPPCGCSMTDCSDRAMIGRGGNSAESGHCAFCT